MNLLMSSLLTLALVGSWPPAPRMAPVEGERSTLARDDDPIDLDITTLTSIDYREGDDLPDEIADLDGARVILSCFMDTRTEDGSNRFYVVSESCSCTGKLKVHHFVEVTLEDDEETDFRPGMVELIGRISIGEVRDDDDFVTSLYRLRGTFF